MSQLLSTEQNRIRDELLGLIDRPQSPQPAVLIGLFGPAGSGKTTVLESLSRTSVTQAARTRNHRRVTGLNIDACAIPNYMLPWQHVLAQVLDRLDEQALPSEIDVIKGLRSKLVALIKRDPKMTAQDEDAAIVVFTKQFRQAIPGLISSSITQANNVLLVGIDHLDKIDANTTADLLDAVVYFLRVPGVAVVVAADEGALVEKINQATESTDGSTQLRSMLQARLELSARAKSAATAGMGTFSKPKPAPSTVAKAPAPAAPVAATNTASASIAELQPSTTKIAASTVVTTPPKTEKSPASAAVAASIDAKATGSSATSMATASSYSKPDPKTMGSSAASTATASSHSKPDPKAMGSSAASTATASSRSKPAPKANTSTGPSLFARIFSHLLARNSPVMLALFVFMVDRVSKILIRMISVEPPGINIVTGWLRLDQYFATTTANGVVRGSLGLGAELVGLFLAIILMLFSTDRKAGVSRSDALLSLASYGLIVGSLSSNLLDRLLYSGVLNFIHLGNLPVFNLAHVTLAIGLLMLVYTLLRSLRT
jgi:lipoprotein signal peptidase